MDNLINFDQLDQEQLSGLDEDLDRNTHILDNYEEFNQEPCANIIVGQADEYFNMIERRKKRLNFHSNANLMSDQTEGE
jgi:hypothetical protein